MDGTHCDYMFVVTLGVLREQMLHQDAQEPKQASPYDGDKRNSRETHCIFMI